jgi:hypothetical protein
MEYTGMNLYSLGDFYCFYILFFVLVGCTGIAFLLITVPVRAYQCSKEN